jgi:hypothetical protein
MEQVHVRSLNCRGPRLELVAGLVMALLMPALFAVAARAQNVSTTTTLAAPQSSAAGSCTLTNLAVKVASTNGVPTGSVSILDEAGSSTVPVALGSALLDSNGQASFVFDLADGAHTLSAAYAGDTTFDTSKTTTPASVTISSQCDSAFVVTVSDLTPTTSPVNTLTPGQAGTATITVVPSQSFVPAAGDPPEFITLSCSGLPDESSCIFTPESVEVSTGQGEALTATMVLQTLAASSASASPAIRQGKDAGRMAWAFLLPGVLGLGGLAWGARRRRWLQRLSLMALVCLVTLLGTTGCNPRYSYLNHGPSPSPATPAGTYTVKVTAQYSNSVTAITQSTSLTLTVK